MNLCMLKQKQGETVFKITASHSSVSTVLAYLHKENTIEINLIHKTLILNEFFKQSFKWNVRDENGYPLSVV